MVARSCTSPFGSVGPPASWSSATRHSRPHTRGRAARSLDLSREAQGSIYCWSCLRFPFHLWRTVRFEYPVVCGFGLRVNPVIWLVWLWLFSVVVSSSSHTSLAFSGLVAGSARLHLLLELPAVSILLVEDGEDPVFGGSVNPDPNPNPEP